MRIKMGFESVDWARVSFYGILNPVSWNKFLLEMELSSLLIDALCKPGSPWM